MLSDFDLAKQSGEPGGKPAMIHTEENGVSISSFDNRGVYTDSVLVKPDTNG